MRARIYLANHVESEIIGHQPKNHDGTNNRFLLTGCFAAATTATTIHNEPSSTKSHMLIISTIPSARQSSLSTMTVCKSEKKEKRILIFASKDVCLALVFVAADPSICVTRAARVRHNIIVMTKAWIRIHKDRALARPNDVEHVRSNVSFSYCNLSISIEI